MSICGLFLVDEDLFLNFLSSSYSLVTKSRNKLLKGGAKNASRGAKDASRYGVCMIPLFCHHYRILTIGITTSSPISIKDNPSIGSFPMGPFNIYLKDKPNFQVYFVRKSRRHILCTQLSIEV